MKRIAIIAFAMNAAFMLVASTTMEDIAPRFPTNTEIVWKVPSNQLPHDIWVYKRLPRVFSAAVISNAIVLASLQSKGFPKPTSNDFFIWEDKGPNYPGPIPNIFSIRPGYATISYGMPNYDRGSGESLPNDESAVARAWASAAQLGLDTNQLKMKNWTSHVCGFDEHGHENIERRIGGRGVFLSRKVDGLLFFATGDDGWNEGFWIEFGSQGNIRAFSINWPGLQRFASHPTADPQQIVACIRARKIFVLPNANEENYSKRIKTLSDAKKIIITKMTPYYGEGIYGETPRDDEPPKWVRPVAELEAVGSFGNSNAVFRILSPILLEDAQRLLKAKDM
jgi:hypothetical protein